VKIRVRGLFLFFFFIYSVSLNPSCRPFECGIHKCAKRCHPPSRVAPTCPYSPLAITHCPCGKHSLSDPSARSHFGSNARLIRTSCTDPVPTCISPCEKPLEGCTHSCRATCHTGPCPPCAVPLVRPCRCGATTRSVICSASQAETDSTAFLCNRPCGALRSCGHHQCTRLCCPLANLANPTSKSKKKTVGTNVGVEFIDTEGWHLCDVICGKSLSCGNHRCEERDHRGSCPPCFRSSFEEVCLRSHLMDYAHLVCRSSAIVDVQYWNPLFHVGRRLCALTRVIGLLPHVDTQGHLICAMAT
jgi:transcriptional repressor NF-X1